MHEITYCNSLGGIEMHLCRAEVFTKDLFSISLLERLTSRRVCTNPQPYLLVEPTTCELTHRGGSQLCGPNTIIWHDINDHINTVSFCIRGDEDDTRAPQTVNALVNSVHTRVTIIVNYRGYIV